MIPFVVSTVIAVLAKVGIHETTATATGYVIVGGGFVLTYLAQTLEAKWPRYFGWLLIFEKQSKVTKN